MMGYDGRDMGYSQRITLSEGVKVSHSPVTSEKLTNNCHYLETVQDRRQVGVTLHVPPALTYVLVVLIVLVGSVYWPDAEGPRVETFSALLRIKRVICIYIL